MAGVAEIVKLVNRTTEEFKFQFDGMVYKVPARGHLLCVREVGFHGVRRSLYKMDPIAQTAIFRCGIEDHDDCSPLDSTGRLEVLERKSGMEKVQEKKLVNPVGGERASGGSHSLVDSPKE